MLNIQPSLCFLGRQHWVALTAFCWTQHPSLPLTLFQLCVKNSAALASESPEKQHHLQKECSHLEGALLHFNY